MNTHELRSLFLEFFHQKGHKVVKSDLIVPTDDPTVLFTSAGMNQFKPQFMGHITDFTRATSCQKCLRTDDLPEVGKTPYHHTFFEMLGNFSFGDYFKEEAITWAWEFLTEVLKIPAERLWVSVHKDDEDAYNIWRDKIGVSPDKIARLGDKTNFWPANAIEDGPNGPCGPCSEIFFDQGEDFSSIAGKHKCGPDCDCGRFAEIWNLVFTQFDRRGEDRLEPLPQKNIDTGMGLERLAAVLQGKKSNFEIDIFKPIIDAICSGIGISDKNFDKQKVYPIADHIRAVVFAIGDGVLPSNEGRGYVLRKLIRKSVWHGKQLKSHRLFLKSVAMAVIKEMSGHYPELLEREGIILNVIVSEEERFLRTLDSGLELLAGYLKGMKSGGKLDGKICFSLYDTYGFPFEMTKEIASEKNVVVDEKEFNTLMEEQRKRSQAALKCADDIFAHRNLREAAAGMKFVGYDELSLTTKVKAILKDDNPVELLKEGDEADIVLLECPFYGESGGQVGDTGILKNDVFEAHLKDCLKVDDVIFCKATAKKGVLKPGDDVHAIVDREKRMETARHHSATHLLQAALRRVLGEHVQQAGSMVSWERLRFDFTHFDAITDEQLREIEIMINKWILEDMPVEKMVLPIEEAKKMNALAFFGEKYGDSVRVVKMGDVSVEFCGGTHVDSTGQIGLFAVQSEKSVATGVRRIEAVVGMKAYNVFSYQRQVIKSLQFALKTSQDKLLAEVERIRDEGLLFKKQLQEAKAASIGRVISDLIESGEDVNGVLFVAGLIDGADINLLRKACDELRKKKNNAVGLFLGDGGKAPMGVLCANKEVVKRSFDSRALIERFKSRVQISGGGRPDMAQIGLKNVEIPMKKLIGQLKELAIEYMKEGL